MKPSPWLPALLGFLIAVGPGATDMYLPAFPAVEASFHSAPGTAQLTLATWFAGLAVGQITQGTAVGPLRPPPAADGGLCRLHARLPSAARSPPI